MMRWGGMTETELQRQRRGGEWKAFYYVSKSLYPSNCFWRGFEVDVDRPKKQNFWAFIVAWLGVCELEFYHLITRCTLAPRSVWMILIPQMEELHLHLYIHRIRYFRVYLFIPGLSKGHNEQTGHSGSFLGATHKWWCIIPCPHRHPKMNQWMRGAVRWNNKVSICERSRKIVSMLFVSRQLQTAATLCDVALKCEPRYWSRVY